MQGPDDRRRLSVSSPYVPYIPTYECAPHRQARNGEAIHLPKNLGCGIGTEVTIERQGRALVQRPIAKPDEVREKLQKMIEDMKAIGDPMTASRLDYGSKRPSA